MTIPNITIDYLANHAHLVESVAKFSWDEWHEIIRGKGETFDDTLRKYQERAQIDAIPLGLVAFADDQLIGTISLKPADLEIRPEIKYWLGGVFVVPEWRGRGVASLMMRRAAEEAERLKLPSLSLWTSSAEGLYLKLGWKPVERTDYLGKEIVIMEYDLKTYSGGMMGDL